MSDITQLYSTLFISITDYHHTAPETVRTSRSHETGEEWVLYRPNQI
jgi:hypothetical protein